jgi:DNA-binding response OmpR family regulator
MMRVLLIEDDAATAKAIDLMLSVEGFNVYTTDLGEEGLDLASSTTTISYASISRHARL